MANESTEKNKIPNSNQVILRHKQVKELKNNTKMQKPDLYKKNLLSDRGLLGHLLIRITAKKIESEQRKIFITLCRVKICSSK